MLSTLVFSLVLACAGSLRTVDISAHLIFSSLLLNKFTNALVRSRPLKEIGAEQVRVNNVIRKIDDVMC